MSYEPPGEPLDTGYRTSDRPAPKKQEGPRVKATRTHAPEAAKAPEPSAKVTDAGFDEAVEEDVDDFLKDLGL
jgi:hypothetical protein